MGAEGTEALQEPGEWVEAKAGVPEKVALQEPNRPVEVQETAALAALRQAELQELALQVQPAKGARKEEAPEPQVRRAKVEQLAPAQEGPPAPQAAQDLRQIPAPE